MLKQSVRVCVWGGVLACMSSITYGAFLAHSCFVTALGWSAKGKLESVSLPVSCPGHGFFLQSKFKSGL